MVSTSEKVNVMPAMYRVPKAIIKPHVCHSCVHYVEAFFHCLNSSVGFAGVSVGCVLAKYVC